MAFSRREFLRGAAGLGGLVLVGGTTTLLPGAGDDPAQTGALLRSGRPLPALFTRPLRIPPVLAPVGRENGRDVYEIAQTVARQDVLGDVTTEIWGYNGIFPGPTLDLTAGRPAVVRHTNHLPVATVVHLHGGHTPATDDGFPTDLVHPVGTPAMLGMDMSAMAGMAGMTDPLAVVTTGSRDYTYPLDQRAAMLWYHDHRMGFTGPGVWKGLAGITLVRDPEESALPLPRGERELPLMICDRSFGPDGSLPYPALDPTFASTPGVTGTYGAGLLGDAILVNGVPWPIAEVPAARHRLRIVNASNARRYRLALSPPPPGGSGLVQIGSDGGLLGAPIARDTITLAPAERVDVVVDFARWPPGQEVTVVNRYGSGSTGAVMRFRVTGTVRDDAAVPSRLSDAPVTAPQPASGLPVRSFAFRSGGNTWTINGRPFDPDRPEAVVARGRTEIWRFSTDAYHPVHTHLDPFLVLSRDGRAPDPGDAGWKDTLDLAPYQQAAVLVRFSDYTGRYLLHCHNLEHEDMAMMSMFTVT